MLTAITLPQAGFGNKSTHLDGGVRQVGCCALTIVHPTRNAFQAVTLALAGQDDT
jgi:hypothetical protein